MSYLTEIKTQVAGKQETTEGTKETLAAADALRVMKPVSFEPDVEMVPRELLDSDISAFKSLSGPRSGKINFGVELKGEGNAGVAPEWGEIIQACGFGETIVASTSVTYAPISDSIPSVTLARYIDGKKQTIWGARGELGIDINRGQPGKLNFEFTGADFSDEDLAMLSSVSYDSTIPPVALNVSLTIDGYSFKIGVLSLKMQNTVELRQDINKASGHFSALIVKRRLVGSMDPEAFKVADYDIYQKWLAGNEAALTITLGSTAGNIIAITAPKIRYTNITDAERNGLRSLGVDFEGNRDAGNDEISIALT